MAENVKVKNAKKVEYAGVKFDSALEVFTYKQLKLLGVDFKYAGVVFEIIPALELTNSIVLYPNTTGMDKKTLKKRTKIQKKVYTPDFVHEWRNYYIIWENKGWGNDDWASKRKLFLHYLETKFNYGWRTPVYLEAHNNRQVLECIEFIKKLG
jgi:hypothetical protein